MGKKFISDYYEHYKPFNQFTVIGLETQDLFELSNGRSYHVRIDRFCSDKEGNYYICDYKTNNQLKAQEELDEDRQLAMYSLWVKQKHPDAKSVKLMWYFLAFDKEMISERSDEQLLKLQAETEALIDEVEKCVEFPVEVSNLCGWCRFQHLCPAFKHKFEVEELPEEKFKDNDGIKLVEEFAVLDKQEKEAAAQKEIVREKLIKFSQQKDVSVIWGTEHKVSVRTMDKIEYPKTEEFEKLLRIKGYDVFTINYSKFLSKILKREVDTDVLAQIKTSQTWMVKVGKK
ncbi:PD-(D/E)XK nuclease family protein [Candidatus Woesearchaeota archaeon]|nr:PD-(D/E)XK nuclease family protein [Candidatus Woesearchaeota archaeon]